MAAEYFATAINHTGNVVVVTQTDDYQIDLQSKATLAVLAKYPDIKILKASSGAWDATLSASNGLGR